MYRQRQARKMTSDLRIIVLLTRARSRCNSSLVNKEGAKKEDDAALRKAIKQAQASGKKTPIILSLMASCQELTKIYDEVFALEDNLLDLSRTSDVEALRESLKTAEDMEVSGSAAVGAAQRRLTLLSRSQEVSQLLVDLCATTDIGIIVARSTLLDRLIKEHSQKFLEIDLQIVKTAKDKLDRYAPLIGLRDDLRAAIERCSLSAINENMEKRSMYAAVLGESYCAEEGAAARNVIRMLSLEKDLVKGRAEREETDFNMADPDEPPDTRLPGHIFDELLQYHNTRGLSDPTVVETLKNIPGIQTYRRCFKWIINYATWRHDDSVHACQSPNVGVGTTIRRGGATSGSPDKRPNSSGGEGDFAGDSPNRIWNSSSPRLDMTERGSPLQRAARTTRTGTRGPRARQPGAKVSGGDPSHPWLAKSKANASKGRSNIVRAKPKQEKLPPSEAKLQEALRANSETESKYELHYNVKRSTRLVDDEQMNLTRKVWAPAQVVVSTSPKKESASSKTRDRKQSQRSEPSTRRRSTAGGKKGWV
jgi:hypothetical protein